MTTFLENLEKLENLFKSGNSQRKQAKSGKSWLCNTASIHHKFKFYRQKHSECTYLHSGFQNFSRGSRPWTLLLEDGHYHRPYPSCAFMARLRHYATRLNAFSISFVHSRPYWQRQWNREFYWPGELVPSVCFILLPVGEPIHRKAINTGRWTGFNGESLHVHWIKQNNIKKEWRFIAGFT